MFGRKRRRAEAEASARRMAEDLAEIERERHMADLEERRREARRQSQASFDDHGLPRRGVR